MAPAAAGYFRRLTRRLTEDIDQLDAQEMTESIEASGGQKACNCRRGEEVTMVGRLRSVDACPKSGNASIEADLRQDHVIDPDRPPPHSRHRNRKDPAGPWPCGRAGRS